MRTCVCMCVFSCLHSAATGCNQGMISQSNCHLLYCSCLKFPFPPLSYLYIQKMRSRCQTIALSGEKTRTFLSITDSNPDDLRRWTEPISPSSLHLSSSSTMNPMSNPLHLLPPERPSLPARPTGIISNFCTRPPQPSLLSSFLANGVKGFSLFSLGACTPFALFLLHLLHALSPHPFLAWSVSRRW